MRFILQRLINIPWAFSMTHALRNKYLSLLEESVMAIHNAGIDICNSKPNLELLNSRSLSGPCYPWRPSTRWPTAKRQSDQSPLCMMSIPLLTRSHSSSEQRDGLHMHFSVESSDKELVPDKFLAGLLKHLRAMYLFIMPNNNLYQRAGDFFLDKVAPVCWDTENKTTPLR